MDAKVEWIDVRDWVLDTYPWKNSLDMKNLNTMTREDVGFVQGKKHHIFKETTHKLKYLAINVHTPYSYYLE